MPVKTFEQPDLIQGSPFTVYAGVDCPGVGMPDSEALARARRRLEYVEPRWIDWHVESMIVTDGDALTDGTLRDMLIEAEDIASQVYGGYATILLTKGMTICAAADYLIQRAGDGGLETVNGTRVGNVVKHPTLTQNIFLTGQIALIKGSVIDRVTPPVTLPDGTCKGRRALAERVIVPLIECLMYSGTATCP